MEFHGLFSLKCRCADVFADRFLAVHPACRPGAGADPGRGLVSCFREHLAEQGKEPAAAGDVPGLKRHDTAGSD